MASSSVLKTLGLTLRSCRYGPYVPSGKDAGEVKPDVARAALLAVTHTAGVHAVSGEPILAGIGRYGAWLKRSPTYVSWPDDEDILAIGLNRAVMLADKKTA